MELPRDPETVDQKRMTRETMPLQVAQMEDLTAVLMVTLTVHQMELRRAYWLSLAFQLQELQAIVSQVVDELQYLKPWEIVHY
jgi:hypothetical protein